MIKTLLLATLLSAGGCHAQPVDMSRSKLTFAFKQQGVPGEGSFRKFDAQVTFDPSAPQATKAAVIVDVGSLDLSDATWNRDLLTPSWFAVKEHPTANFTVNGAKSLGGDRYEAPGKFTLKGITRDVVAKFAVKSAPGAIALDGTVPIRRSEFRIGEGTWADPSLVADEVVVRFQIHLQQ